MPAETTLPYIDRFATRTPCCHRRIILRCDTRNLRERHLRTCRACREKWTYVVEMNRAPDGLWFTTSVVTKRGWVDEFEALLGELSRSAGWLDPNDGRQTLFEPPRR